MTDEDWAKLVSAAGEAARRSHRLLKTAAQLPPVSPSGQPPRSGKRLELATQPESGKQPESGPAASATAPRGAALLVRGGRIFAGPEVLPIGEGPSAAEVVALYAANMEGLKSFRVLILRGGPRGASDAGPPSGSTLQILAEFAPRLRIFWGTDARPAGGETVTQLLPGAFDRAHLPTT